MAKFRIVKEGEFYCAEKAEPSARGGIMWLYVSDTVSRSLEETELLLRYLINGIPNATIVKELEA